MMFTRAGWTTDAVSVVHRSQHWHWDNFTQCAGTSSSPRSTSHGNVLHHKTEKLFSPHSKRIMSGILEWDREWAQQRLCRTKQSDCWSMSLHNNQQQHNIRCAAYVRTLHQNQNSLTLSHYFSCRIEISFVQFFATHTTRPLTID